MEEQDASYHYEQYCRKIAEECESLEDALSCVCEECGAREEVVMYYVKMHDKDEDFDKQIFVLGYIKIAKLLLTLLCTDYDIFVPWYKRECLELMTENPEDLSPTEQHYQRVIKNWYEYYQKSFDEVSE